MWHKWRYPLISFAVAFCSLIYELGLSQLITCLQGNSILRYSLTTGIFIAALGFGALFHFLWAPKRAEWAFIKLESALALLGALAAPLILAVVSLNLMADGITYFWMLLIGMLNGYEIPLLIQVAEADGESGTAMNIVAFDYIGSFVGALLFPWLFKSMSLIQLAITAGMINLAVAIVMAVPLGRAKAIAQWLVFAGIGAVLWVSFSLDGQVRNFFSRVIYGTVD